MDRIRAPRPGALRRRNGRLQACDPCRARKVACDHAQPVCGRCLKRNQAAQCAYTISTGLTGATSPIPTRRRSETHEEEAPASEPLPDGPDPVPSGSAEITSEAGFLGFTNPITVFKETRQSLSLLNGRSQARVAGTRGRLSRAKDSSLSTLLPPLRESCLLVLAHLPCLPDSPIRVADDIDRQPGSWEDYMLASIVNFLRSRFKDGNFSGSQLEQLAELINSNTARPLRDIHSSSKDWLDQFCGANLRWESLGLMWANIEHLSDALTCLKPSLLEWAPGQRCESLAMGFMKSCLHLAQHFNQGSDLIVDLCRRISTLESQISGDASFATWTCHGLTVSALTSRGMHLEQSSNESHQPSLCSEFKRWLFCYIFASDKVHSCFSGRPPLLASRFCTTPMPIDLGPEELIQDPEGLQNAVRKLDRHGWGTSGQLYPATMARPRFSMGYIMEEIVDIALSQSPVVTLNQLDDMRYRQHQIMAGIPKVLQFDPEKLKDPDLDIDAFYASLLVYLTHLLNIFFIERLRLTYGASDNGDLLITSFDLVTATMTLWQHKDRFTKMRRNFEWLLMACAAPGGGILCLELLRPVFTNSDHPRDPRMTRSKVVQQLSLLAASLDWVQPSAPNGDLCLSCKEIIEHVLDHHLNAPNGYDWAVAAPSWDVTNPFDFNFELLDTFDWLQGGDRMEP